MSSQASAPVNNTRTIARNSVWYGLEVFFSLFAALVSSILVARVIGPERLGYFQYVVWLTNITTTIGAFGLPMTTRRYMAECLNRGEPSLARAIYDVSLRIQILIAVVVTGGGLAAVFLLGDPAQRLASTVLVLNMAPRVVLLIPSQANNAAELMQRSTPPALIGGTINVVLTLLSLWLGYDLPGVAAAFLAGSTVEAALKLIDVHRRLAPISPGKLTPELRRRMFSYSGEGLVLMLLNVLVWDRSDLIILKNMNPDIKQVTFFSIAFNLTERALMIPSAFGYTLGTTMMAQYGRGEERLGQLTVSGAKYALLLGLPLLSGMACIAAPAIRTLYGAQYLPVAPALAIAAFFAISKAVNNAPYLYLQTVEKQGFLIWTGCLCGAIDIVLDFLLTPAYGAVGAAFANGIAQTLAMAAVWYRVYGLLEVKPPLAEFGRIVLAGLLMIAAVLGIQRLVGGRAGLALSVAAGAAVWCVALRLTRAVTAADYERLLHVAGVLPKPVRPAFRGFMRFLQPAGVRS